MSSTDEPPAGVPTLGVEEEYLLLDAGTGEPLPVAEEVSLAASLRPAVRDDDVQYELLQVQLEVSTPPCQELDEIGGHLLRLRHELGSAAEQYGARLAATGAAPWHTGAVPVTDSSRYRDLNARGSGLVDEQLINGMHVHVGVPDPAVGIEVVNRLRPDLPILLALAANSPFWRGRDSGFESWRSIHFHRWPAEGPPPHFADAEDYRRRVAMLLATGALRNQSQLYWQARISHRQPTVEVRCPDVQLRVDEAVMVAGLVRALVMTALQDHAEHLPYPVVETELLTAASWAAAREGLNGDLFDLRNGRLRRAGDVLVDLLEGLDPALAASGDGVQVHKLVDRALREGNGAARQRETVRGSGFGSLVELVSAETMSTWPQ